MATAVTAFIGRALKGPVDLPVALTSFDDYQRIFGGLWQPSSLSYAVEQYFENGGRSCLVVRVCNGGRAPTLTLRCGAHALVLVGLSPGTREYLRAAVDYDGIAAGETDRFNLVVQRLRAAGTELIEDQEIFRRVSIHPDRERPLHELLAQSRLVNLASELPIERPDRTSGPAGLSAVGYIASNTDGDDGDPLTNYDLIGDARLASGLFALRPEHAFNFLCLPPLARDQDVGLAALLVALRLCRERQAMLLVDPPASWSDAPAALEGLRNWPFQTENAAMFYPRVLAFDRLRGRYEQFGSAAAVAGYLARADQVSPVWAPGEAEEPMMRPGLRPAVGLTDLDRARLSQSGVNGVVAQRQGARWRSSLRTLLPEVGVKNDWRSLSTRRFALFLMASIERGTRWVRFEHNGAQLREQVVAQVTAFFEALARDGAFPGSTSADHYFVICDERLNGAAAIAGGQFQLLFGVALFRAGDFQSYLVTHRPDGSCTRAVSVNRFALPDRE
jgi:hypothetical protein